MEDPVDLEIKSFASLNEGWLCGEGGPIPQSTIDSALEWRNFLSLNGVSLITAHPGVGREILLTTNANGGYLEIMSESDSTFTISYDVSPYDDDIYHSGLSMIEAKSLVLNILKGK